MSTRCVVNFCEGKEVYAKVYRHSDGYPDGEHGVPASLEQFFSEVEKQTKDTRFNDPNYLAAKYVVWQSGEYAASSKEYGRTSGNALDFLGVGVVLKDPGDIEYSYFVDCDAKDNKGRPVVTYKAVR